METQIERVLGKEVRRGNTFAVFSSKKSSPKQIFGSPASRQHLNAGNPCSFATKSKRQIQSHW